jgi:hypothetical protein
METKDARQPRQHCHNYVGTIPDLLKIAGQQIDPATAEVEWWYALTLDPYGVWENIPEEYQQVGREYFARAPGTSVWVNFGVCAETRDVPRRISELDPETAKLIEDVRIDSKGRLIPKLYSKLQANKELRAMLNLGARSEAPDVTKLSDSELIAQLAQQAKELGIEIDLNYSFAQPKKSDG